MSYNIMIEDRDFQEHYPERHFSCTHNLQDHPLLGIDELVKLAGRLPAEHIEYNAGNLPVSQNPELTPGNGLSAEETIQRIAHNKSWLVLKYINQDPAYHELLQSVLGPVIDNAEKITPGIDKLEGYIFVSSPHSVTPFHVDNEHNFLLQIQGSKVMHTWHRDDREVVSEIDLERYHRGAHRNLTLNDQIAQKGVPYHLEPGTGVFQPVTAPHWVQNGDEVSISLSLTFRSDSSVREAEIYRVNGKLRSIGLKPGPVGRTDAVDSVKYFALRASRKLMRTG